MKAIKDVTFSKWIIRVTLLQCFAMMWASYILAFIGRVQIAEGLSKVVAGELVLTCLGYFTKAGVENLSKHNENWPVSKCRDL